MDWFLELRAFGAHAAVAAAVAAVLLGPARPLVRGLIEVIARAPRGKFAAYVVALAFLLRLALLPSVQPVYEADVEEYCEKAVAIAVDGTPREQETREDGTRFYRTLGWSLPLAGWYLATGLPVSIDGRVRSAQVFGAILGTFVVLAILALGRACGRETAGRLAALGYALFIPAIVFSIVPYSETWTTLLLVVAVWLFEKLRRAPPGAPLWGWGVGLGIVEGLLLITRFEFAWLPLLAAAMLVADRRSLALAAGLSLVAVLVPLSVNYQMRSGYDGLLRMSSQSGLILYFGNNPIEVTGHGNASPAVAAKVRDMYERDPSDEEARDAALLWMKTNPGSVLANVPKKLYHLWLAQPQGFTWHIGKTGGTDSDLAGLLRHASWVQALLLVALGLVGLVGDAITYRFWILVLLLHAAVWSLLAASARNRYPLEPLLFIPAAACLAARSGSARRVGST